MYLAAVRACKTAAIFIFCFRAPLQPNYAHTHIYGCIDKLINVSRGGRFISISIQLHVGVCVCMCAVVTDTGELYIYLVSC